MGLEPTGFARANMDSLWVDPTEYIQGLKEAVEILDRERIRTSLYNLQLCILPKELWPFARKSISDWKNEYIDKCSICSEKSSCAGFFSSSVANKMSPYINPLATT
jgi:hypothetical protein